MMSSCIGMGPVEINVKLPDKLSPITISNIVSLLAVLPISIIMKPFNHANSPVITLIMLITTATIGAVKLLPFSTLSKPAAQLSISSYMRH